MTPWFETVRLTAKLSPSGHRRLDQIFGMCAELYNANLESWEGNLRLVEGAPQPRNREVSAEWNLSLFDRMMMFTGVRADPSRMGASLREGRTRCPGSL